MSYESNVTVANHFFTGEDKILSFEVFASDGIVMENVATFTLQWELRYSWEIKSALAASPILSKSSAAGITVTGSFNSSRALNTQRVLVAIADTDTENLNAGRYFHTLKRIDAGLEAVLSHGTVDLKKAAVK